MSYLELAILTKENVIFPVSSVLMMILILLCIENRIPKLPKGKAVVFNMRYTCPQG